MLNNLFRKKEPMIRQSEIDYIINFFKANNNKKSICTIIADGGIGKSFLCNSLISTKSDLEFFPIIDFKSSKFFSILSIIEFLIESSPNYIKTKEKISLYYSSLGLARVKLQNDVLNAFLADLKILTQNKQFIIVFDTIENLKSDENVSRILNFIERLPNNVGVILSGRECELAHKQINEFVSDGLQLHDFSFRDLKKYINFRTAKEKIKIKINENTLVQIYNISSQGKPLLCAFIMDMFRENKKLYSRLENSCTTTESRNIFIEELISALLDLPDDELNTIKVLVAFHKKINPEMLTMLFSWEMAKSKRILNQLERFSFIKKDYNSNYIIHEEILKLLKRNPNMNFLPKYNESFQTIISYYDNVFNKDERNKWALIDKISYLLTQSLIYKNLIEFDRVFKICLDNYDYDACDSLISCFDSSTIDTSFVHKYMKLLRADMYLQYYKPLEAFEIYDVLSKLVIDSEFIMFIIHRAKEGKAACYVNPSTAIREDCTIESIEFDQLINSIDSLTSKNAIIYINAINELQETLQYYETNNVTHRLSQAYFLIAKCYQTIGNHNKAYFYYDEAIKFSDNKFFKAQILEEKSNLYRLQQDLPRSLTTLAQSLDLTQEKTANYYYNYANICRDKGDPETARTFYDKALTMFHDINDIFKYSEVCGDWSWLEYLQDNEPDSKKYLEEYRKICFDKKYKFAVSYSEYHHMLYHLQFEANDHHNAYSNLDKAILYAVIYQNIYILLDCLNHKVSQIYDSKDADKQNKIYLVINNMLAFENKGCGYKAFVGRAMITYGKTFLDNGDQNQALNWLVEGFERVAKYGDSGTNVEVFNDLFQKYKMLLSSVLRNETSIIDKWISTKNDLLVNAAQELKFIINKKG